MLVILLCLGIVHGEMRLQHKSPAYFPLFGNIGSIEDIFLPEDVGESDSNITTAELQDLLDNSVQIGNIEDYFTINNINQSTALLDERDFNEINLKFLSTNTRKRLYGGLFFFWYNTLYDYHDAADRSEKFEEKKIKMLQDFALDFLFHSRKKIEGAFGQRDKIRKDKRYKLGYLFNRLRRIKTEMRKIVNQAQSLEKGTYKMGEIRQLDGLMRDYERVVRMDIDIRDTCLLIQAEFNVPAPYDIITDHKTKPKVHKS